MPPPALASSEMAPVSYTHLDVYKRQVQAAVEMGLSAGQGRLLAQATFAGAAALASQSPLSPTALREQVTSKGGTTHAAITTLDALGVRAAFVKALHAARVRSEELGRV